MNSDQLKLGIAAAALLGALSLSAFAGHHFGAAGVQAAWDRDALERTRIEKAAVLQAVAANEKERQADLVATRATLATYKRNLNEAEQRIAAERAAADRLRLRIAIPARVCTVAPGGEAPGPVGTDGAGATEELELPEPIEGRLRDLAQDAESETERLRAKLTAIQDWARSHGFYEAGVKTSE